MAKKQKRARLIYNPTSGQEIMKKNVAEVLDVLEGFGYETSAFQTTPEPNSARDEAKRAAEAGFDLVIAAGGDGTINEVVNGIAPLSNRPQMAIIPTGTTNDFARALKIPRGNPVEAAKIIGKSQIIQMDIGQAREDTYFINIAAAGSFTELTYSVPSQLKTMFGYLAYLAKGVELLPGIRTVPVRIKHEKGTFEGDVSMIFAAITNSVGGFEQIAPDAKLDDGKFTLIFISRHTSNLSDAQSRLRNQQFSSGLHAFRLDKGANGCPGNRFETSFQAGLCQSEHTGQILNGIFGKGIFYNVLVNILCPFGDVRRKLLRPTNCAAIQET